MTDRHLTSILSVTCDETIRSTIDRVVSEFPRGKVTHATAGSEALKLDTTEDHQLVIASVDLGGPDDDPQAMDGFELASRVLASRRRPVVLIGEMPRQQDIVWAMRIGVADFLPLPLQADELLITLDRCLGRVADAWRERDRHYKLRSLLQRALNDRRDLNRRIDLVCRDLVGTQRRLFHRVLALEHKGGPSLGV